MNSKGLQLVDLGERRLIAEVLAPRYCEANQSFGDDSALAPLPGGPGQLLASTDPCPPPMSRALGFDDYFYDGWLLATINLSDLAAAGAEPIGLLTSLQLPAEMELDSFIRLLDGIDACCKAHGAKVLGGNLKESPSVDLNATAMGWCDSAPLSRKGARAGDCVLILGELGLFWAATLSVQRELRAVDPEDQLLRNILRPKAKTRCALRLRKEGLLSSCMDNSDGLQPSLMQLADANRLGIRIDKASLSPDEEVRSAAAELAVDPARLALGWGDWQLVATCRKEDVSRIGAMAAETGTDAHVIGKVVEGSGVELLDGADIGPLLSLDSERFSKSSWFAAGLSGYVEQMLTAPLIDDE